MSYADSYYHRHRLDDTLHPETSLEGGQSLPRPPLVPLFSFWPPHLLASKHDAAPILITLSARTVRNSAMLAWPAPWYCIRRVSLEGAKLRDYFKARAGEQASMSEERADGFGEEATQGRRPDVRPGMQLTAMPKTKSYPDYLRNGRSWAVFLFFFFFFFFFFPFLSYCF